MYSRVCSNLCNWWLPHSDIPGSQPAHGSPRLNAVCHVLHRLFCLGIHHVPLITSNLNFHISDQELHTRQYHKHNITPSGTLHIRGCSRVRILFFSLNKIAFAINSLYNCQNAVLQAVVRTARSERHKILALCRVHVKSICHYLLRKYMPKRSIFLHA